jgi:hypothetical protein
MNGFRRAQTSHNYFGIFIGVLSLVILLGLTVVIASHSVDSKRAAAEAKEQELRELAKALFVDGVVSPPQPVSSPPPRNSIAPPASPQDTTTTFSAANGAVTMTDPSVSGTFKAGTYPIPITVSGVTGTIAKVTVTLDVHMALFGLRTDVLLQGPGGRDK